jgi:hypothetical protein
MPKLTRREWMVRIVVFVIVAGFLASLIAVFLTG